MITIFIFLDSYVPLNTVYPNLKVIINKHLVKLTDVHNCVRSILHIWD